MPVTRDSTLLTTDDVALTGDFMSYEMMKEWFRPGDVNHGFGVRASCVTVMHTCIAIRKCWSVELEVEKMSSRKRIREPVRACLMCLSALSQGGVSGGLILSDG